MISVGRRSSMLHRVRASDLWLQSVGCAALAIILGLSVYAVFLFFSGVFLNDWKQWPTTVHVVYPFALWMVALYFTVVRFLSYLDLRIRQEGWEVELKVRAAAARWEGQFV